MKNYSVSIGATVEMNRFLSVTAENEEDLKKKISSGDIDDIMDDNEISAKYDLDSMVIEDSDDLDDDE